MSRGDNAVEVKPRGIWSSDLVLVILYRFGTGSYIILMLSLYIGQDKFYLPDSRGSSYKNVRQEQ